MIVIEISLYIAVAAGVFLETNGALIGRIIASVFWPMFGALMLGFSIGKKFSK